MVDFLYYLFLLALLALLILAGAWFLRAYLNGISPVSALFGPRPERRLAVVEHTSVDSRRRLLLVRRDHVEHLIMTGGPVDVVIETGINAPEHAVAAEPHLSPPVFSREPRSLGQPSGENAG